jgi:hypothetical protein
MKAKRRKAAEECGETHASGKHRAGSHGQCFPVRGLFSGAISQRQSYVINLNGAGSSRWLVQSKIVVTGSPPEEPTDRKALSVATNSRSFIPFNGRLLAEYYCGGMIFDHPDEICGS